MLKVTFFIKEIHAGQIITSLDKIAIDLAMTPAKSAKSAKGAASGGTLVSKVKAYIASHPQFTSMDVRRYLTSVGEVPSRCGQILNSLKKQKHIKRTSKGKYKVLV